jgi:hypothetical protein
VYNNGTVLRDGGSAAFHPLVRGNSNELPRHERTSPGCGEGGFCWPPSMYGDLQMSEFSIARLKRAVERILSRGKDYSGLRAAPTSDDAIAWFRQHSTRMLNGNVLRAKVLQGLVVEAGCDLFVETGTSHAATAIGVSRYLNIPVWSCENSRSDHIVSRLVTLGMADVSLACAHSIAFLSSVVPKIASDSRQPIFYLDAHEGRLDSHSLPLVEELSLILGLRSFVVIIDDFQVPRRDGFVFGSYGGASINLSLIQSTMKSGGVSRCYFPAYEPDYETGFVTGYCVLWKSPKLDIAFMRRKFPFDLLAAHDF